MFKSGGYFERFLVLSNQKQKNLTFTLKIINILLFYLALALFAIIILKQYNFFSMLIVYIFAFIFCMLIVYLCRILNYLESAVYSDLDYDLYLYDFNESDGFKCGNKVEFVYPKINTKYLVIYKPKPFEITFTHNQLKFKVSVILNADSFTGEEINHVINTEKQQYITHKEFFKKLNIENEFKIKNEYNINLYIQSKIRFAIECIAAQSNSNNKHTTELFWLEKNIIYLLNVFPELKVELIQIK